MQQPTEQFEVSVTPPRPKGLPEMPAIGQPEAVYAKMVHQAERQGDPHARAAAKVGQYITLALDPSRKWEDKLKYFRHALKRHCQPPPYPDDAVWMFYQKLANLVRQYCGQEALRIASQEDDLYAARLTMGQTRGKIEDDAEEFFTRLMGHYEESGIDRSGESSLVGHILVDHGEVHGDRCPEWFNEEDWAQLKLIRDQWI
jgi:hypothetical protein